MLAATVALGLLLAACSANPTPSTAASASAATASATTVKLSGSQFNPTSLTVKVGTKVTFQNTDTVDHTVTNGKNGIPEADPLFNLSAPSGLSVDFTFTTAGTFNVTCTIHHSMHMTIIVQ